MSEEKKEYERFSISLPRELFKDFEAFRKKNNLVRSDAIRKAMREYIVKETKEEKILSKEKTMAVIILTLEHIWEGEKHDHYNLSSEKHTIEHSHNQLDDIMSSSYFTKPDTDLIKINHIEHYFHDIVISKMHIHTEHDKCLLVIPVKGAGKRIQEFYKRLISLKSVLSYNIYI